MVRAGVRLRPIPGRKAAGTAVQREKARSAFEGLMRLGKPAPEVLDDLERKGLPWVPSKSTFYGWVSEWTSRRKRDASGIWSVRDGLKRPDLVLEVLGAVIVETSYRVQQLTRAEADWIVKVRTAAPGLSPWEAYAFAQAYLDRGEGGVYDLDEALAFAAMPNGERRQKESLMAFSDAMQAAESKRDAAPSRRPATPAPSTRRGRA